MLTLTPAYGRDYKSKKEIEKDLNEGKDFVVNSYNDNGRYINREQLLELGMKTVNVRYADNRKVTVIAIK